MNSFLANFKGSYSVIIITIIISLIFTYIDGFVSKNDKCKPDYIKAALVSGISAVIVVYINTLKGGFSEEVITGIAPF